MNEITKAEMRKRLGNITQLQDLLFGEQINQYNHKLEQYNQRLNHLEANSQKFQLLIEERMAQLENKLLHKINAIANSQRKIKYVNLTAQQEQSKIQQQLDTLSQHSYENIDFLQNSLNAKANSLKMEIAQSKSASDQDLQLLKQQIFEKLESSLTELSTNKVSRGDLAEVLFELCLKLKKTDANLELPESVADDKSEQSEFDTHADLMLPETK
ncbi:MAG TPA: hypothetical protein V6C71_25840 [Coleofasciculaceae cyanobacterium]|jgi:hypothetical protein